jgi:hypothetical protein
MAHHVGRQLVCRKCDAQLTVAAAGLQRSSESLALASQDHEEPVASPTSAVANDIARLADVIHFQRFLAPHLAPAIYWLGSIGCIIAGLLTMAYALATPSGGALYVLLGAAIILLGPLALRIGCELVLLLFRIDAQLTSLRADFQQHTAADAGGPQLAANGDGREGAKPQPKVGVS